MIQFFGEIYFDSGPKPKGNPARQEFHAELDFRLDWRTGLSHIDLVVEIVLQVRTAMKKILTLSVLLLLTSLPLSAQKIAKYAGEFMAIGVGGRALGMGGAYVAAGNDVTMGYWNPAGLMLIDYPELALMHDERFGNLVNYDYGGVAIPLGKKYTLGIALTRLGIDGIPDTRNALIDYNGDNKFDPNDRLDYSKITTFSATDWAMYVSYAVQLNSSTSMGANLKLIRRDLAEASAMGVGFDVGILIRLLPELYFGANVQDITTTLIAWNNGTKELISPTAKVGMAYMIKALGGTFTPALDFDIMAENRRYASLVSAGPISLNPRVGLEYRFKDLFAIRGGFTDTQSLTLGAGVHLPKLYIDYSFAKFDGADQLDNTHRISLRLTLQEPKFFRDNPR